MLFSILCTTLTLHQRRVALTYHVYIKFLKINLDPMKFLIFVISSMEDTEKIIQKKSIIIIIFVSIKTLKKSVQVSDNKNMIEDTYIRIITLIK